MDRALANELLAFKKKAISNTSEVDNDNKSEKQSNRKRKAGGNKKQIRNYENLPPQIMSFLKKNQGITNTSRNYYCKNKTRAGILVCIVNFLKDLHLKKEPEEAVTGLTVQEILDKTQNLDTSQVDRCWLETEALINNPRVKQVSHKKFAYKPYYDVSDKRSLLKLLENYNDNGLGGILIDELRESTNDADQKVVSLRNKLVHITRVNDKKDVIYYHDSQYTMNIDPDFINMWKQVNMEPVDDKSIEKYLSMSNISCFKSKTDLKQEKLVKKKPKSRLSKMHNVHLADGVLKDYDE